MISKGVIVQITNKEHHWYPCLIIVDEVKIWGIQGYTTIPNNKRDEPNGDAYIRLKNNEFETVGRANIVSE